MIQSLAWEDLSVMLAALDHGSLNRAAAALRIGQSTASRRLVRLEERLGGRLFDRTPEGLLPTGLALELEPHARNIEGHMSDIQRVAEGQEAAPQGRVRLAMVDGLGTHLLGQRLSAFYDKYPGVQIDLLAGQAVVDLVRREADLAVRFIRPSAPDLVSRRLGEMQFAAFAHPSIAEDPDRRWVGFFDPSQTHQETRWMAEHVAPQHITRASSWNDLFGMMCAGVGAGVVSPLVAERAGLVRVARELPPVPSRDLHLVYHRAMRDVPRVAVVRRWLVKLAAEILDAPD